MGSVEAPLSLNSGCIADNVTPHYLRPSAGSCHDICKYGRRRSPGDSSADAKKVNRPSHDTKSFSSRPKNHANSPSKKRGGAVSLPAKAQVQVKEANNSVGKKPYLQLVKASASVRPKPVMVSLESSHGVNGRNAGASMLSAKKAWVPVGASLSPQGRKTAGVKRVRTGSFESIPALPSSSSPFQEEEDDDQEIMCGGIGNAQHVEENEIKTPSMEAESNQSESVFERESVTDAPSTSSLEEADELVSDTSASQKMNDCKRQRRSRTGDKRCRPVRIKFRMGNQMQQHKEDNALTRHELKRTRSTEDVSDSSSSSRTRDQPGSMARKNRCGRVRNVKTRVLVLDNMKRKCEKEDAAAALRLARRNNLKRQRQVQRRKDVQFLFSYVVEETVSMLAERRKGTVKSLIGTFESLISVQTRSRFLRITT